jgi:hypothetical protein
MILGGFIWSQSLPKFLGFSIIKVTIGRFLRGTGVFPLLGSFRCWFGGGYGSGLLIVMRIGI